MAGLFSSSRFCFLILFFFFFVGSTVEAGVLFSSLKRNLVVSASPKQDQVLKAGVDEIRVSWALNASFPAGNGIDTDAAYKKVKVKLCYAKESQKDRGWRKTVDDLKKDKTCQFVITNSPYKKSNSSYDYLVERNVPSAIYFVRAYLLDASGTEVAFGQTTNTQKSSNLFQIVGITGRHKTLDIAAGCFSAFSLLSLVFFYVVEKRKTK